jgi:hypothetical protein
VFDCRWLLTELPRVREAFAAGELSYCKVRALTRVATEETEAYLVELARHATGAQLEKVVRGYRGALAATLDSAEHAYAQRYLRWSWNDDGSLQVQARIPADDGALLLAALRAAERMPAESADARDADALVTVARTALSAGSGDGRGDAPAEVVVHVDAESLAADLVHLCSHHHRLVHEGGFGVERAGPARSAFGARTGG